MKKKEPIGVATLIIAVISLVIGIILFLNKDILNIIGYITSALLLIYGVIKSIGLMRKKKKGIEIEFSDVFLVILVILFGVLIAIFPKSVSISISIVLGTLAIIMGINRLILAINVRKIDSSGSTLFILEAILLIVLGILIITQKFLNLLGLFLIIYAISELISYVYYKTQSKDYEEVFNKKVSKEIKESKSIEAVIEEK